MWKYLDTKGIGRIREKKSKRDMVCTQDQFAKMIRTIEGSQAQFNKNWVRDRALIYIAYNLGLRIGEAAMLERSHFQRLEQDDVVAIPTLKQKDRIPFLCKNCGKRSRVTTDRLGEIFACPRCGEIDEVTSKLPVKPYSIPLRDLPFVEGPVASFIVDYISKLPPDQKFLFPSRNGGHLSESFTSRIFSTYAQLAGLSPYISFHSLRHGRGMRVYSMTGGDLVATKDALRHRDIKTSQIYASLDEETRNKYKKSLEKGVLDLTKSEKN